MTTIATMPATRLVLPDEPAGVIVTGYFYAVDLGENVRPQHHRVGINGACTCSLGRSCPAVEQVRIYLASGGKRAERPPFGFYPVAPSEMPGVRRTGFSGHVALVCQAGRRLSVFRGRQVALLAAPRLDQRPPRETGEERKDQPDERVRKEAAPQGVCPVLRPAAQQDRSSGAQSLPRRSVDGAGLDDPGRYLCLADPGKRRGADPGLRLYRPDPGAAGQLMEVCHVPKGQFQPDRATRSRSRYVLHHAPVLGL